MTERSLPAGHGIVASPGDGARSHPRIEALLGRYPALSAGELARYVAALEKILQAAETIAAEEHASSGAATR